MAEVTANPSTSAPTTSGSVVPAPPVGAEDDSQVPASSPSSSSVPRAAAPNHSLGQSSLSSPSAAAPPRPPSRSYTHNPSSPSLPGVASIGTDNPGSAQASAHRSSNSGPQEQLQQQQQHQQHLQQLSHSSPHHPSHQSNQAPPPAQSHSHTPQHEQLPPASSLHSIGFDRGLGRGGLPPILSPPIGTGMQYAHSSSDMRQPPVSPRTIPPNLSMNDAMMQESISGDTTAPRKRSKVSRACDECRRKKIRCDATSESGIERCSSCKRVGSKCSFSRIPMKRGPSKGYIKELADRLNTLENSISTGEVHYAGIAEGELSPHPLDAAVSPTGANKRKRALSSGSEFHTPVHLQPLGSQHSPIARPGERLPPIDSFHRPASQQMQHSQLPPQGHPREHSFSHAAPPPPPPLAPHSLHSQQRSPQLTASDTSTPFRQQQSPNGLFWKGSQPDLGGSIRRPSSHYPYDNPEPPKPAGGYVPRTTAFEWNEEAINEYYEFIHPTFPILSDSRARLHSRLSMVTPTVREAFLEALYSATRACPASRLRNTAPDRNSRAASELALKSQFEEVAVKTFPSTLLQLQTLLLLSLEADIYGPGKLLGLTGPPRGSWLGAAIGLAYSLRLHQRPIRERLVAEEDSDEKICRRAWWVLVMFDRWHAMSTYSPSMIPDSNVSFVPEDEVVLGSNTYHVARLSIILGHLAEAFVAIDDVSPSALNPFAGKLLRGEIDRFREGMGNILNHEPAKLVRVVYHHVELLMLRQSSTSRPGEILDFALRIARTLEDADNTGLPLQHHFAALSLTALLDLAEIPDTRDLAWDGIHRISKWADIRLSATRNGSTWEKAVKEFIERRRRSKYGNQPTYGALQHLADLAMGERSPTSSSPSAAIPPPHEPLHYLDAARLQRQGYLGSILV